ncbi:MAG: DUF4105 domain-containing protein, partial [Chitinophagaceae bacterium]
AQAQTDTASSHLRISVLTVGVGDEIYASFGHTGIRVLDSATGSDKVYNWGTFDGFQDNFELKFMQGKLLYYCSSETFLNFYQTYVQAQRRVQEQVILLDDAQKAKLQQFLEENLEEANRYYKYDFLYDNCATRLRDVFPTVFGKQFKFGQVLPKDSKLTFREIIDKYLAPLPWERFGIDLLLGSKLDKPMSNEEIMFLPDYLRDGIAGATVNGKPIAQDTVELLPAGSPFPKPGNGVLFTLLIVAALVIFGSVIPGFNIIGAIAKNALLIVIGLLGFLMLFMWLGTDHKACSDNWNVLWALPTNLIIPFVKRKKRSRYAIIAMLLIVLSLVFHFVGIQEMPLRDLWPLLLALLFSFGMIYKAATTEVIYDPADFDH